MKLDKVKQIWFAENGWYLSTKEESENFYTELQKELPEGHFLYGKQVEVVAHRLGTDDILCQYIADQNHYTVIHLTWTGKQEKDTDFPTVEVDGNFEDFMNYENRFTKYKFPRI